jgi:hypothetical protein
MDPKMKITGFGPTVIKQPSHSGVIPSLTIITEVSLPKVKIACASGTVLPGTIGGAKSLPCQCAKR